MAFTSVGGSRAAAACKPLLGIAAAMQMPRSISITGQQLEQESPGSVRAMIASVNGESVLLASVVDRLETVFMFRTNGGKIEQIWAVSNPDKLSYIHNQLFSHSNN